MAVDALGITISAAKAYALVGITSSVIGTDVVKMLLGDRNQEVVAAKCSGLFNMADLQLAILIAHAAVFAQISYVDGLFFGNPWKVSVRAATTANVNLSTAVENGDSIDGITLATGDRVLAKNQSSASENGIYVVQASGSAVRAIDGDAGVKLVNAMVAVQEGTANADKVFTCTTNAPITLGSTSLTWVELGATQSNVVTVLDSVAGDPATTVGTSVSTEQTLYSKSIAGGTLGLLGAVKLIVAGDMQNNSGGSTNFTVRVKYGATTWYGDLTAVATSANRRLLRLEFDLSSLNNTSKQRGAGTLWLGDGTAGSVAGSGDIDSSVRTTTQIAGPAAEDSESAKNLDVTIQFSTTSANQSVRLYSAKLLKVPA